MRRLLAVSILALAFVGTAFVGTGAGAPAATAADPLVPSEWWLSHVGADRAEPPGPGVPITIVDSGVDPTHPEFAGRPNTTFLNAQSVTGPAEYHGTIVASLAAAPANGVGIEGLYPQAALQVYDASPSGRGIGDNDAIAGILAAAARCPGVISLSFGGVAQDPQLEDAILTAFHNGCLVVAAAGNGGELGGPIPFPAAWPHVLTVGATDRSDTIASFSSTGQAVDLVAPGVDMVGAVPLTRNPTGYAEGLAGTSFAAPLVAAAAAWVWTERPSLTVTELADVLRRSARDLGPSGFDPSYGFGILDVPAALAAPTPPPDAMEPNDDVAQVRSGRLFEVGQAPLTTPAAPSARISASIDSEEDPRDVYRIWVPAHRTVRVTVASEGRAAVRIWGPLTVSVNEGVKARRRDLRGPRVRANGAGFWAYAEVLLTGRSRDATYTLAVTATTR
ncbi:MAG TPA: S8 family serine peptidase [Gaiellaceae bacterium]|nr:S8 family serine peptidase [Gaiellaceae bacterium]